MRKLRQNYQLQSNFYGLEASRNPLLTPMGFDPKSSIKKLDISYIYRCIVYVYHFML